MSEMEMFDISNDHTLRTRFCLKRLKVGDSECWPWIGSRNDAGYGQIGVRGADGLMVHRKAHRVAYALEHGSFANELCVLHRCDNPRCVNPTHLSLGTQKDNIRDMIAKGRNQHVIELSRQRMTGRRLPAQTRLKMRIAKLGSAHWRAKAVRIGDTTYPCQSEAARANGVTEAAVRKWVKTGRALLLSRSADGDVGMSGSTSPSTGIVSQNWQADAYRRA